MLKLKPNMRWILPLVIVALAVVAFALIPAIGAHAAVAVPNVMSGH